VTEANVFENICMLSLKDMPVDKRLLHSTIITQAVFLRNDQFLHYDIYAIALWVMMAQSVQRLATGRIESVGGGIPQPFRLAVSLTQPPVQWVRGRSRG